MAKQTFLCKFTEIKSYTQHNYKAGNTCKNMPETAAYSSATTEDQHVQGTSR